MKIDILDISIGFSLFAVTLMFSALIVVFGTLIWDEYNLRKLCGRWEVKTVWQEPYTSYRPMIVGKVTTLLPVRHQGRFVEQRLCVEPKPVENVNNYTL